MIDTNQRNSKILDLLNVKTYLETAQDLKHSGQKVPVYFWFLTIF